MSDCESSSYSCKEVLVKKSNAFSFGKMGRPRIVPLAPYGSPLDDSGDKHDKHRELNRSLVVGTTRIGTTNERSPYLKTLNKHNDN